MKSRITIVPYVRYNKVNFYSFQIDEEHKCEAEKFFDMLEFGNLSEEEIEEIYDLANWLRIIGDKGAHSRYFRFENSASALPPYRKIVIEQNITSKVHCMEINKVRLYCTWVSDNIII